jgi:hypothetical protein
LAGKQHFYFKLFGFQGFRQIDGQCLHTFSRFKKRPEYPENAILIYHFSPTLLRRL